MMRPRSQKDLVKLNLSCLEIAESMASFDWLLGLEKFLGVTLDLFNDVCVF